MRAAAAILGAGTLALAALALTLHGPARSAPQAPGGGDSTTVAPTAASSAPAATAPPHGAPPGAGSRASRNTCLECHRDLEPRLSAPTVHFAEDIHAVRGLGCVGCHGGNPNDPTDGAMDPDHGFRPAPARGEIAESCARCHASVDVMKRYNPQPYIFSMSEFRTSVHCKKISEGDEKVATCTNCHGVHGILPHTDPRSPVYHRNVPSTCAKCHNAAYMKGRTVPTNQFTLYSHSVHGRALLEKGDAAAPACNNCHGNHGAVPPNTRDISVVCGNCHGREGELFAASPVKEVLELEGKRGCVTCHGNHDVQHPSDEMIGTTGAGVCGRCHEPNSPGAAATAEIVPRFHALKARIGSADTLLRRAEQLGMPTEDGRELLKQAGDQLVNVRAALHSFDRKQIDAVLVEGAGYADRAHAQGENAIRDWRWRRIGMALSLIVILALMGALVLKIREIERPAERDTIG